MKAMMTCRRWYLPVLALIGALVFCAPSPCLAKGVTAGPVELFATIPGSGFIEGPSYNPDDGYLYFVEIEAGWISRVSPQGKYEQFYNIGAAGNLLGPNGMIYDGKKKRLLIAHRDMGIVSLDPKTKELKTICHTYNGIKLNGPNDLCIDSKGNIYFSDTWATSISNRKGAVYRIDAQTGDVTPIMENLAFPNGILLSPDEQFIYCAEFGTNRLLRGYLINGGKACIFLHVQRYFNGGWGVDSMGMDEKGNLYIALFGGGKVYVLEPKQADIIDVIESPDPEATGTDNARFGGPDNKTLYITEGFKRCIYKVRVINAGMPIPPPPPAK
jgi:gluconolactonase